MPSEIEAADRDRARQLTDEIKTTLTTTWELIVEAWETRAWAALGYESWDHYCAEEFDSVQRLRLPREER